MIPLPPSSTLFPYTTLFRSLGALRHPVIAHHRSNPQPVIRKNAAAASRLAFAVMNLIAPARDGVLVAPERQRQELAGIGQRSEEHTSELQSQSNLVCRLLLE